MTQVNPIHHASRKRRAAFTLVELIVSMAIMTILMGAMGSVLLIASRAIPDGTSPLDRKLQAATALDQITGELMFATSITEQTATAVTFTVADRGHGATGPETIRYEWSGTPGAPLTRQYNGGTVVTIAEDVQRFSLSYSFETGSLASGTNLLFVTSDSDSPPGDDVTKMSAIQSWGYTVQPIDDDDNAAAFAAALATSNVIFVSERVWAPKLTSKPIDGAIGVVTEEGYMAITLGISSWYATTSDDAIDIIDDTHEIMAGLSEGKWDVCDPDQPLTTTQGMLAPGAQVLAEIDDDPSLIVLDEGAIRHGGGAAMGRRVKLPWGGSMFGNYDFSALNTESLQLMRRAIVWAASSKVYTGATISLQPTTEAASLIETQAQILNKVPMNGS